jgi:mRNA interferase MazF
MKIRPAVALRIMPSFGDILVCGISTQLHQQIVGFDEIISSSDADFAASGLRLDSLIRLGFLTAQPLPDIVGVIGAVSSERHARLLRRLSHYLMENIGV